MSAIGSTTRIRDGGQALVVECTSCGVAFRRRPSFDRDVALGTFLQLHPSSAAAVHRPGVPAGWSPVEAADAA